VSQIKFQEINCFSTLGPWRARLIISVISYVLASRWRCAATRAEGIRASGEITFQIWMKQRPCVSLGLVHQQTRGGAELLFPNSSIGVTHTLPSPYIAPGCCYCPPFPPHHHAVAAVRHSSAIHFHRGSGHLPHNIHHHPSKRAMSRHRRGGSTLCAA